MNYIALGVISEIDDIYGSSIQDDRLRETILTKTFISIRTRDVKKRTCGHNAIRGVYTIFNFFYLTFYFYFMPFVAIALSQVASSYDLQ